MLGQSIYKKVLLSLLTAVILLIPAGVKTQGLPRAIQPLFVSEKANIGESFLNEELTYQVSFWFLDDVAKGTVSLKKGEGEEYIATLTAHTRGAVEKLVFKRKDIYIARMGITGDGKRFVTRSFEKEVELRGKTKKSITWFDYDKKVMNWKSWDNEGNERSGTEKLPEGIYCDDPLSAFYNFRFGAYGPVEGGKDYLIHSFPKNGEVPRISLKIASKDEMDKRLNEESKVDYLADVVIDKELFGSKTGYLEVYFTRNMVPIGTVVKDLVFFGDVTGKLVGASTPKLSGIQ